MNRLKNGIILIILISNIIPFTCIIKTVTGIYCPACGMTRSFLCILHFDFINATYYNLFGIPFFIFIIIFVTMILRDFILNRFSFVPKLLGLLGKHYAFILVLLVISTVFNNLKYFMY